MDDKGLISQVDDPRDTIARLEGCHGTGDELTAREVLDGPMIITVLNILQGKHKQGLEYKKTRQLEYRNNFANTSQCLKINRKVSFYQVKQFRYILF